jgi:predicted ester cyclase
MPQAQNHIRLCAIISLFMFCSSSLIVNGQVGASNLDSNKKLVISYISEVVNNRELGLINQIFSPAFVSHNMEGKESHDISDSSLFTFLNYFFKAFPDLHDSIESVVAESDLVALRTTVTGTHKDLFLGFAATNKKIVFKEMFFFRVLNRKIVEGWNVVDVDGIKRQIANK